VIIGTAGHIDHGKTSLVEALTGTNADRLKEEKQRGITIDLGFAYWPQEDGSIIGFVDVPGHEGYIHNMLAGATGIAALLLVVAANEGIKPQTLEHLLIARQLGIKQAIVAITKADLSDEAQLKERQGEIHALLETSPFQDCPIISVSTKRGQGIDDLKRELQNLAATVSKTPAADAPARFSVDRSFTLDGAGTIVTGALRAGMIKLDDKLLLSPSGREVRVRGIHAQNKKSVIAQTGDRAALNLANVKRDEVKRGDMVVAPELHHPTTRVDCIIRLEKDSTKPLPVWAPVHVHSGTGHWPARLVPLEQDKIFSGQSQLAQLVFETPIAVFAGDPLILRDASATKTLGGGTILDRRAGERNRRKPDRLKYLKALAEHGPFEAIPHLLQLPPCALDIQRYAADHGLWPSRFKPLIARENIISLETDHATYLLDPAIMLLLQRQIKETLGQYHERFPDQAGMTQDRLRLALDYRLLGDAFEAVVAHLAKRRDIAVVGAYLRMPDHIPRLSPEHEAMWAKVKPRLEGEHRFKPPKLAELVEELKLRPETLRGLMKRLARRGDVQEITPDHFLNSAAVAELATIASDLDTSESDGWFNAATYRDQLHIGRKMAILILEFFDTKGFTIRKGDLRKIDPRKKAFFVPRDPEV
jgi:selenocysteine-specific elongation factor